MKVENQDDCNAFKAEELVSLLGQHQGEDFKMETVLYFIIIVIIIIVIVIVIVTVIIIVTTIIIIIIIITI